MYIYELPDWPNFAWDQESLTGRLAQIRYRQGRLLGKMESLGFKFREEALLQIFTTDVLKSSEIEGEKLDPEQVRSSIARQLGLDIAGLKPADRHIDGVVTMTLDATRQYDQPLTVQRLFSWHAALFPNGYSGPTKIRVGAWRDDSFGAMTVVSAPLGRQRVHSTQSAREGSAASSM